MQAEEMPHHKSQSVDASAAGAAKNKSASLSRKQSATHRGAPKRQGTATLGRAGTVNLKEDCPTLPELGNREHQDLLVELEHLRSLNLECMRERGVTQSCQGDVKMLREQLERANDRIVNLEKVRKEQATNLVTLEKVRSEQQTHIKKLEEVRIEQKSHIDMLV